MQREKIIFILSAPRSGSTWLGYVLGSMPGAAFLGEYRLGWTPGARHPCTWCGAGGVETCPVFEGIDDVPSEQAYDFAFAQTACKTLIDSSKHTAWAHRFLRSGRDVQLVHLIRDPRGWYASQVRRTGQPLDLMISEWVDQNASIADFVSASGAPYSTVFYDRLASAPKLAFASLCAQLNLPFHTDALRYWEGRPHHALAGNGASSNLLFDRDGVRDFQYFVTGDDAFYLQNYHRLFTDDRWRNQLSPELAHAIQKAPAVEQFLARYGCVLGALGLNFGDDVNQLRLANS